MNLVAVDGSGSFQTATFGKDVNTLVYGQVQYVKNRSFVQLSGYLYGWLLGSCNAEWFSC